LAPVWQPLPPHFCLLQGAGESQRLLIIIWYDGSP
jgi:hypothetical protein